MLEYVATSRDFNVSCTEKTPKYGANAKRRAHIQYGVGERTFAFAERINLFHSLAQNRGF